MSIKAVKTWRNLFVWIGGFLVGIVLIGIIMVVAKRNELLSSNDIPLFDTMALNNLYDTLVLRVERDNSEALLLKLQAGDAVYRYDPRAQVLSLVSIEDWKNAQGSIVECEKQIQPSEYFIDESHHLWFGKKPIKVNGNTVLKVLASPSGKLLAVLSADGEWKSTIPFVGGGVPSGQHYHQILSVDEGEALGKPVRLPLGNRNGRRIGAVCWSADDRYVVYADFLFSRVSIVSVVISGDKK